MKTKRANRHPFRSRPPEAQVQEEVAAVALDTRARTAPVLQFVMDMGAALKNAARKTEAV